MDDQKWREPVMPTAKELRMISAAKRRIRERETHPNDLNATEGSFSWCGFAVVVCVLMLLASFAVATLYLIINL